MANLERSADNLSNALCIGPEACEESRCYQHACNEDTCYCVSLAEIARLLESNPWDSRI